MKLKKLIQIGSVLTLTGLIIVLMSVGLTKSRVQEIAGLAVAESSTKWNYLRDAAFGDGIANGIGAFGLYLYNGVNFDRARGDSTYGLDVDVTRMPAVSGSATPSDNYSNPSTAITTWSLLGIYDGSTWDRVLASVHGDNLTTSQGLNVAGFNYYFDGTNWDRVLSTTHGDDRTTATGLNVAGFNYFFDGTNWDRALSTSHGDDKTTATGLNTASFLYMFDGTNWDRVRGTSTYGLQISQRFSYSNINTNATTTIKSGSGVLHSITINTPGSGSTATVYDNTIGSGTKIATIKTDSSTITLIYDVNFSTGLTIVTTGTTAADITVSYL